ncbi:MAG: response regulator [Candidatus Thermoplasmatota archaeon]|nr:response regulator [Candidatus Thermoplasmatota archaeon]
MKKQILIADKDPKTRTELRNIFEREGHDVYCVENGIDCLHFLERGFNGILLIDLVIPQLDGWATIKKIVRRRLEKNVSIIVMTATGTIRHQKMKGLEPYVYDYIVKPFDAKQLIQNINKLY